jgi:hypothetical protein
MRPVILLALFLAALATAPGAAAADDKKDPKPAGPVTLTVVSKKDKYVFDGGGKSAKEYKAAMERLAKVLAEGDLINPPFPPKPPAVDLALVLTNTTKEAVKVFVGGDTNVFTLELTGGAGVVAMPNPVGFTEEFRLPKAVTIEPGKTHEVPVKLLADGHRGLSRLVYWTGPGEYKLTAKYVLAKNADGEKGAVLTSEPAKIVVAEK